jgi:hypothetical protein
MLARPVLTGDWRREPQVMTSGQRFFWSLFFGCTKKSGSPSGKNGLKKKLWLGNSPALLQLEE